MVLSALDQAREELPRRLRGRREEIERVVLTRVYGVSDPSETAEPEYVEGLRSAVSAAIDYGLAGIEGGERNPPSVPPDLLLQARVAARSGVSLDTVLRRYFAGYTLLGDFLIEEAEDGGLEGAALKQLLRAQASIFDRLITAVTDEYGREEHGRLATVEQRRAERVKRLLDGELLDTAELGYELDAFHLGLIAVGSGAPEALRELSITLDRRLLLVHRAEGAIWAWLGARRPAVVEEFERHVTQSWPAQISLAIGEPAHGLDGWRLTHRQAQAALPIALRSPRDFIRYADVALLASILQDDLLSTSLHELYLVPLGSERDGGMVMRKTLRAYFAAERNVSSTAAALGVSRQTVVNRLHSVEERFGRTLNSCAAEVEAALALEELGYPAPPRSTVAHG